MAGDWIKIGHTLPGKPEVDAIAVSLGIDHDAVIGKLVRLWIWADQQMVDCNGARVTETYLDRLTNCTGFAAALVDVGWLASRNGRLSLPNFDRHNGQTAKSRALTSIRVKRSRNDRSVTSALPEKRREEKRDLPTDVGKSSPTPRFVKPTVEEVRAYCAERGNSVDASKFWDFYESKGWRVGKSAMKSWQACVRTWESESRPPPQQRGFVGVDPSAFPE